MANRRALMVVPLFASSNWSMTNTIFIRFNRSFLTFPSFLYPVPYFLSLTRPNRLVHRKTRIWVCRSHSKLNAEKSLTLFSALFFYLFQGLKWEKRGDEW
jgi:hypothetical protein